MSTVTQHSSEKLVLQTGIIDCDVHVFPRTADEIKRYLPQPFKRLFKFWENSYYVDPVQPQRTVPPDGGKPGSDPDFLRKQLFENQGLAAAILLPKAFTSVNNNPYYAAAVASAYNDWLAETWLGEYNTDGRFKGSITIAHQDPGLAAEEIDRMAKHPHFVQVLMDTGARLPFGHKHYYPIYEACQRHGLPLAIHPGTDGMGINTLASPGYPSYFLEWCTGFSFAVQSHLMNLIVEGVFNLYPNLKFVVHEGGIAWIPAFMWRFDSEYKSLRSETPWVKKKPSEYLKDHFRFSTQPLERSAPDGDLLEVISMFDYESLLLYGSDYPDEFYTPPQSLSFMPAQAQRRILSENAKELYSIS